MDECIICGKESVGEGVVEGARVSLCDNCMRYAGKVTYFDEEVEASRIPAPKPKKELVLADDFGKLIHDARLHKNLSRKELAEKVFIRENELAGFEENRLKPVESVAKKIEYALGIKLLAEESVLESTARQSRARKGDEFSLADVVKIKKK